MGKLLSFAIPCYNSAEYMEHCINTVLAGGDEVEVIIDMEHCINTVLAALLKDMKRNIRILSKLYIRKMVDMVRL